MQVGRNLWIALRMTVVTSVLLGGIYPLTITLLAQWLFPDQANGQLIVRDGRVVGSRLIGQSFTAAGYFHPRPSATATPYDAANSAGSQLGPTNEKLVAAVSAQVAAARRENPGMAVPIDLVTASASGVDPHITPAAARFQVPRVARARSMPTAEIQALVDAHTEGRTFGLLGEARVNVLTLNLALDAAGRAPAAAGRQ